VVDILSYLRRRKTPADPVPIAEDEAINLETIGGEISNSYVDIASTSDPPPKPPTKERPLRQPERSIERQPERQAEPQPELQLDRPPDRQFDLPPDRQIERAPERAPEPALERTPERALERSPESALERSTDRPPPPQRSARPPNRPRRRSDGNGAIAGDRKGVLSVHGVQKSFVGRMVVKGVSLYVRRGEAVGLLGPNGAGKTTVFYMTTGLIKADKGRIELDGHDVTQLPMYQRARLGIGYLPQEASIFRGLNVEDNIRAVLEVIEPNAKRREDDLNALLEEFNIARLRKTPSIALSGGERRRVEIARALATRPSYMLLDEPFAGIDPIAVGDIQALVRHLTNRGIGVLITDHNVRETLGLTDRAYIIYSGEVLMEGRPDDIVNNPDVRRLYLGEEFRL